MSLWLHIVSERNKSITLWGYYVLKRNTKKKLFCNKKIEQIFVNFLNGKFLGIKFDTT